MTESYKQGFNYVLRKFAADSLGHGKYSPIGALLYGGLGAGIGALVDRKKRKRGALIGALLGALGGTATDVQAFVADRKHGDKDAARSAGARLAELETMQKHDRSRMLSESEDLGRAVGRRDKAVRDEDGIPLTLTELASAIKEEEKSRPHAFDTPASYTPSIDKLKAVRAYTDKGLGKIINPDYNAAFDAGYEDKIKEMEGWSRDLGTDAGGNEQVVRPGTAVLLGLSAGNSHKSGGGRRAAGAAVK